MTWMWTDPDELIAEEAIQREESGYPVLRTESAGGLAAAFELWKGVERVVGWPYVEPDSWPLIVEELPASRPADDRAVGDDVLRERLEGAWWGRCVGNCAGKPLEAGRGWNPDSLQEYLESVGNYPFRNYLSARDPLPDGIPWVGDPAETSAESISAVPKDDDLNYTLIGLRVLEKHGSHYSTSDFAEEWVTTMPYLAACTAERVAYRNLVAGLPADIAGSVHNPYREWVGALIRADALGYAFPGEPMRAARAAWADGWLSHRANGLYGEIWVAALLALALTSESAEAALRASLGFVPQRSRLATELTAVLGDWERGQDPESLVRAVHLRHPRMNPVHTINNAGIIAAAVVSSGDSFDRAIATSIAGCLDTDSNTATVGSVVGAIVGRHGIASRWTTPFRDTLRSDVLGFDGTSVQDVADRIVAMTRAVSDGA